MTEIQSTMLAVCFGGFIGIFVGNIVYIIMTLVDSWRWKKHRKKIHEDIERKVNKSEKTE